MDTRYDWKWNWNDWATKHNMKLLGCGANAINTSIPCIHLMHDDVCFIEIPTRERSYRNWSFFRDNFFLVFKSHIPNFWHVYYTYAYFANLLEENERSRERRWIMLTVRWVWWKWWRSRRRRWRWRCRRKKERKTKMSCISSNGTQSQFVIRIY